MVERMLVDPLAKLQTSLALVVVRLTVETIMLVTLRASKMWVVSFQPDKEIIAPFENQNV